MRIASTGLLAVVLATGALTAACSGDTAASGAPQSSAPQSSAPQSPATASKPTVPDMATDRFADAVLEQIKVESPDAPTDQLVTIAMSPLLRQLATSADITTRLKSRGDSVSLVVVGADATCTVRVTDAPRARGVVCKSA